MELTLAIIAGALALCLTALSVGVVWATLKHYPAVSRAEVHRKVHEQALRFAILRKEQGEASPTVEQLAEQVSNEAQGFDIGRKEPDLGLPEEAWRPRGVDDQTWARAVEVSRSTGEPVAVVAMELMAEEGRGVDTADLDEAFGPKGA